MARDRVKHALNNRNWRAKQRENPSFKMNACKRRAKEYGIPFNLPLEFFENMPTHCPQCDAEFPPIGGGKNHRPSVDRDDPMLGYVLGNCEWLCGACNRRKNDQSWAKLLEFAQRGLSRSRGDCGQL